MSFRRRALVYAALTANAIRPLPGFRAGVPSFFAGWITGELAPQWLAVTTADAATHLTGRRRDPVGLALAGAAAAGLGYLIHQARRDQQRAEAALSESLGVDYQDQLDELPTPADLATPWRSLVNPFRTFRTPPVPIRVERDIAFGEAGRRNFLDIYRPEMEVENAPVLLQVHGGAWMLGKKEEQGVPLMQHLAAKGWICVAINYRLSPRDAWPAQVVDVKKAIHWIRQHIASYGGDPDYIAITGGSAGGHLTALTALTPHAREWQPGFEDADTSVQVAVPHYGVYDFAGSTGTKAAVQLRDLFLAQWVMKQSWEDAPELYEDASPILRITPDAPDFFVIHGAHDSLVPVDQARQFVARLRERSKRSVVYAELPGAQHAFDVFPSIRSAHIVRAIDRYLHWHWNQYRRERGRLAAAKQ
ncbi:MAG TPA: alpha/beta hydrolase [Nocardioides sp.]|uniref:alpha/beta hydrolase n=1 Tax=uncultured Nocardioides sp. TaxID=198441 RepID=UPI000EEC5561|nr:alpha/beta hydrolase [uncultured Nocardioides sp.]HCB05583.1 alpha/beta hydrolase [Nocardioides sp.]HRD62156.1 alpha/beta hydrolase [Nocardioides sp.]HRI95341.1 alpha/beta hydrolase [Nocardioides sp.]